MNVKEILDDVALQVGVTQMSNYAGNSERTALELVFHLNKAGQEITRRAEWSRLYDEFTVDEGDTQQQLPSDFHRLVSGGAVRLLETPFTPLMPVNSRSAWHYLRLAASTDYHYFVSNGAIRFSPALPSGGAEIRYVSKNWVDMDSGVSIIDIDTREPEISGELLTLATVCRFKRAKGMNYTDENAEFEAELAREIAADRGLNV